MLALAIFATLLVSGGAGAGIRPAAVMRLAVVAALVAPSVAVPATTPISVSGAIGPTATLGRGVTSTVTSAPVVPMAIAPARAVVTVRTASGSLPTTGCVRPEDREPVERPDVVHVGPWLQSDKGVGRNGSFRQRTSVPTHDL